MKYEGKEIILVIGLFLLLSIFIVSNWLPGSFMIMGHDSGYRLVIQQFFASLMFTWVPGLNFGISALFNPAVMPIHVPELIASYLFHGDEFIQKSVLIFWHAVNLSAIFLAYLFVKPKLHTKSTLVAAMASIFYAVNFLNLHAWSVIWRAKFSAQFMLPLLVFFLYTSLENQSVDRKKMIIVAILMALCNAGGSPPLYGPLVVAWLTTGVYAITISQARTKTALLFVKTTLFISGIFAALSAFWLVPYVAYAISSYASELQAQGGLESLIGLVDAVSKNASILNIFRLQGLPAWDAQTPLEFIHPYLTSPLLILGSFVWPFLFVGAYFLTNRPKERQFIILMFVLFLIGTFFTAGSHPPTGSFFTLLMSTVPGFGIFRTAFYKFGMIPWFAISMLCGFSVVSLTGIIGRRFKGSVLYMALPVGFILFSFLYHLPFIQGNFFDYNTPFTNKIRLPGYVKDAASYIHNTTPREAKILLMPRFDLNRMDGYAWGYWGPDPLPRMIIDRPVISDANNPPQIVDAIYRSFYQKRYANFLTLLKISGIQIILWRSDALYSDKRTTGEQFNFFEEELQSLPDIELSASFDKWRVYTVRPHPYMPLVHASTDYLYSDVQYEHYLDSMESTGRPPDNKPPLVAVPSDVTETELIKAQCVLCDSGERDWLRDGSRLVPVSLLPGSRFYFLVDWHERRMLEAASSSPQKLIQLYYDLVGIRMSEMQQTHNAEYGLKKIEKHLRDARQQLATLSFLDANQAKAKMIITLDGYTSTLEVLRKKEGIDESLERVEQVLYLEARSIEAETWYTKNNQEFALIAHIPKEGTYDLALSSGDTALKTMAIDGKPAIAGKISLGQGIHRILVGVNSQSDIPSIPPRVYFLKQASRLHKEAPKVTYIRQNPTSYRVHVTGATGPYILNFSQLYDPQWSAYAVGERIDEDNHMQTNGFANGWYIDKLGEYDIYLKYEPQRFVIIGFAITAIGCVFCAMYLRRHQKES